MLPVVEACFTQFDEGAKGYLDVADLKVAMLALLGFAPSKVRLTYPASFRTLTSYILQYELHRIQTWIALEQGLVLPQNESTSAYAIHDEDTDDDCDSIEVAVTLPQFVRLMEQRLHEQDRQTHIRHIFRAFDTRCQGFLALEDLTRAVSEIGLHTPPATLAQVFSELDHNRDGKISFKRFEEMILSGEN
jgi:Ca2+-binding EF-hand superfamily protein